MSASARRALAVCADDFGLRPDVDEGIARLAMQGRLSATSCLVSLADWPGAARRLGTLPTSARRGLHFNLTAGVPASIELRRRWPRFPPLAVLIALAHLRRLPLAEIEHEWRVQRDRFADATGHAPHFVDGHQHVHHLPAVREIVIAGAEALGVAVRSTGHVAGPGFAFKRFVIEATGGRSLAAALRRRGIEHNDCLLGVYDFGTRDYGDLMRHWLQQARQHAGGTALLMCHPAAALAGGMALQASLADDPIACARRREAEYLGSTVFEADLEDAGLSVAASWPAQVASRPSAPPAPLVPRPPPPSTESRTTIAG